MLPWTRNHVQPVRKKGGARSRTSKAAEASRRADCDRNGRSVIGPRNITPLPGSAALFDCKVMTVFPIPPIFEDYFHRPHPALLIHSVLRRWFPGWSYGRTDPRIRTAVFRREDYFTGVE